MSINCTVPIKYFYIKKIYSWDYVQPISMKIENFDSPTEFGSLWEKLVIFIHVDYIVALSSFKLLPNYCI